MTTVTLGLRTSVRRGATVLRLRGTADRPGVSALRQALATATRGAPIVVVDLDDVTLANPDGVRELISVVGGHDGRHRVHLVARRNSITTTLARWRIHHVVAVHRTFGDALLSHRPSGTRG